MTTIERVPRHARDKAVAFLAGGAHPDAAGVARAGAMDEYVRACGSRAALWWAHACGVPLATALVVSSPGRTGMVLHSPAVAAGVDYEALVALLRESGRTALDDGLAMVQSMEHPTAEGDAAACLAAGYERLAELVFMRLDVGRARPWREDAALVWRGADRFDRRELADVIARTYEASRDCPALRGVRRMEDVIEGHVHSGVYWPEGWWIVACEGRPAGCVLVNRSATADQSQVAYLGVVPECRGRGLARAMVRRAAAGVAADGRRTLTLAVDADNPYAYRAYKAERFRQTHRQVAYMMASAHRLFTEGGGECV